MNYEDRVQELRNEGIPAAEARRLALQEIRVLKNSQAEEVRRDTRINQAKSRQTQANVRIGFSAFRIIMRLFK